MLKICRICDVRYELDDDYEDDEDTCPNCWDVVAESWLDDEEFEILSEEDLDALKGNF